MPAKIFIALTYLIGCELSFGAISLGISGFGSVSNAGLEKYHSLSFSANLSLGLGQNFRVGITHRRAFEKKEGLKKSESAAEYFNFNDDTKSIANSIDLTIVLFVGQVSPFVFGGIARRDYDRTAKLQTQYLRSKITLFPVPTHGFGFAVFISRDINFKITQTYSPGVRIIIENGEEKHLGVVDSYTQAGITYKL